MMATSSSDETKQKKKLKEKYQMHYILNFFSVSRMLLLSRFTFKTRKFRVFKTYFRSEMNGQYASFIGIHMRMDGTYSQNPLIKTQLKSICFDVDMIYYFYVFYKYHKTIKFTLPVRNGLQRWGMIRTTNAINYATTYRKGKCINIHQNSQTNSA